METLVAHQSAIFKPAELKNQAASSGYPKNNPELKAILNPAQRSANAQSKAYGDSRETLIEAMVEKFCAPTEPSGQSGGSASSQQAEGQADSSRNLASSENPGPQLSSDDVGAGGDGDDQTDTKGAMATTDRKD